MQHDGRSHGPDVIRADASDAGQIVGDAARDLRPLLAIPMQGDATISHRPRFVGTVRPDGAQRRPRRRASDVPSRAVPVKRHAAGSDRPTIASVGSRDPREVVSNRRVQLAEPRRVAARVHAGKVAAQRRRQLVAGRGAGYRIVKLPRIGDVWDPAVTLLITSKARRIAAPNKTRRSREPRNAHAFPPPMRANLAIEGSEGVSKIRRISRPSGPLTSSVAAAA